MRRKRSDPGRELRDRLIGDGWMTPDTWDGAHYAILPDAPGIYLLMAIDMTDCPFRRNIAYVGKSSRLSQRLKAHPTIREIFNLNRDLHVERWFRTLPAEWIGHAEIEAIRRYDPALNLLHRKRDVARLMAGAQA